MNRSEGLASQFRTATPEVKKPPPYNKVGYPNFWQVGCVFDTILDYFYALNVEQQLSAADRTLMEELVPKAVIGYRYGIVGQQANWYDDWCWWGIAASKAFDPEYEWIFGDKADLFRNAAMDLWGLVDSGEYETLATSIPQNIWDVSGTISGADDPNLRFSEDMLIARAEIHQGTRNSWARILRGANGGGTSRDKKDYETFTSPATWATPRYLGGCWQYDFSSEPFPVGDGPNGFWKDPSPFAQNLGVEQVTLMQGLYLSFCSSLEHAALLNAAEGKTGGAWDRLQPASAYRSKADEVVAFLGNWMPELSSPVKGHDNAILLYERVPTYAELGNGYPPVRDFQGTSFFWAGDQGLVMGALKQYGSNAPADLSGSPLQAWVPQLLRGMFYNMAPGGVIAPFTGSAPDPEDYGSGAGIFWRYVLRCCRIDPAFGAMVRADPQMLKITKESAETAASGSGDLFNEFNNVAAALGAWAVLR
jgi:hypothetical protein